VPQRIVPAFPINTTPPVHPVRKSMPVPEGIVPAFPINTTTPVQPLRHCRKDALSSSSYLTTLRYPSPVGRLARPDLSPVVRKPAVVEESTCDLAALLESAAQKPDKHYISMPASFRAPLPQSNVRADLDCGEETCEFMSLIQPSSERISPRDYISMPASFRQPLPQTNARADPDCGEETMEFMSLLQPSSERISPEKEPSAHGTSAGGASASSSSTDDVPGSVMPNGSKATEATAGLLDRGRRLGAAAKGGLSRGRQALEPSIGTQMATAEQFINSVWRWAMSSAQQAVEVANTSCRRMATWSSWVWLVFLQKIIVVVIIVICAILLLGELSWRLGDSSELHRV